MPDKYLDIDGLGTLAAQVKLCANAASKKAFNTTDADAAKTVTGFDDTTGKAIYGNIAINESQVANLPTDLAAKAEKVSGATSGNFASLDSSGNLADSGKSSEDFASAAQGNKADSAIQSISVNGGAQQPDANKNVNIGVPTGYSSVPKMDGTGYAGVSAYWAHGDHVHPSDTSREDVSNKKQSIDPTSTTEYGSSKAVADFVNSSVATNTANFLGSFTLTDLGLTYPATDVQIAAALNSHTWPTGVTPTNNDYVYVEIQDPQTTGIDDKVERFKFSDLLESWGYEYTLNNSSFTAAEMATLESGITASDKTTWNAAVTDLSTHTSNSNIHVTSSDKTAWDAKQNAVSTDTDENAFGDETTIATGFGSDNVHLNLASRLWTYISGKVFSDNGKVPASNIPDAIKDKIVFIEASFNIATQVFTCNDASYNDITGYLQSGKVPVVRVSVYANASATTPVRIHELYYHGYDSQVESPNTGKYKFGSTDGYEDGSRAYVTSVKCNDSTGWGDYQDYAVPSLTKMNTDLADKVGTTGYTSNTKSTFTKASGDTSSITSGSKLSAIFTAISSFFASLKALAFKDTASYNDLSSGVQSSLDKADSALQDIVAASGAHIGDVGTPSVTASTDATLKKTTLTFNYLKGNKGDPGTNGTNGKNGTSAYWFNGTAVTGTGTGISATVSGSKAGDMYLNSSTQNVYTATAANTWNYVTNIKGAPGAWGGTVDSALSTTSTNPVQNSVVTANLNRKLDRTCSAVSHGVENTGNENYYKFASCAIPNTYDNRNGTFLIVAVGERKENQVLALLKVNLRTFSKTDNVIASEVGAYLYVISDPNNNFKNNTFSVHYSVTNTWQAVLELWIGCNMRYGGVSVTELNSGYRQGMPTSQWTYYSGAFTTLPSGAATITPLRLPFCINGTGVGSPTLPVYVNSDGSVEACNFNAAAYHIFNNGVVDNIPDYIFKEYNQFIINNSSLRIYAEQLVENICYKFYNYKGNYCQLSFAKRTNGTYTRVWNGDTATLSTSSWTAWPSLSRPTSGICIVVRIGYAIYVSGY